MAVRFDAAGDFLSRTATVPNGGAAFTWMGWFLISTDLAATGSLLALFSSANPGAVIGIDNSLNTRLVDSDFGGTTTGSNLGTGTFHHIAWVRSAGNVHTAYFDGVADGITLTAGSSTSPVLRVGQDPDGGRINGRVEAVKLWTAALTQVQIAAEMPRYDPVVTANNWAWWPLTVHTDVTDHSANARHFTANGTLTTEAGPGGITEGGASNTDRQTVVGAGTLAGVVPTRVVGVITTPQTP